MKIKERIKYEIQFTGSLRFFPPACGTQAENQAGLCTKNPGVRAYSCPGF